MNDQAITSSLTPAPSGAADLPSDWKLATLGDLGEVRYGLGQPPAQVDDGIPMVRATIIKRGRIVSAGLIRIKREAIPESHNPYLKLGDIVVARSGAYTGDVAMVTIEWAGAVAGYDLVFSPSKLVDSELKRRSCTGSSPKASAANPKSKPKSARYHRVGTW